MKSIQGLLGIRRMSPPPPQCNLWFVGRARSGQELDVAHAASTVLLGPFVRELEDGLTAGAVIRPEVMHHERSGAERKYCNNAGRLLVPASPDNLTFKKVPSVSNGPNRRRGLGGPGKRVSPPKSKTP